MKDAPFNQAWTARLRVRLAKHGSKAELARFLAALYGHSERSWQCRIQEILKNRVVTSVEIHLAIENFLSKP
jgi:hypothetical protein